MKMNIFMKRLLFAFVLIVLFYFPCYISNDLLLDLTKEDGAYEYVGAFLFLLTAVGFFMLAVKPERYKGYANAKKYPERKYFWLLALVFLLAFGEEISWGQRIFNFETPEVIKENNVQEEFNLHNLEVFHGKTKDGEEKTGIMALLTIHKMFYLAFLTYLFIIPLLHSKNSGIRSFVSKVGLPVPNIVLGLVFVFNWIYAKVLETMNTELDGHGIVEIKEAIIALILFTLSMSFLDYNYIKDKMNSL